jgi:hypothetical protein
MRFAIRRNALMQIIIDSLNDLITAFHHGSALSGKDELQKRHEHPDGHNREENTAQDK